MRKQDLIRAVAKSSNTEQKTVKAVLNSMVQEITKNLKEGGDITITGLGKFYTTTFKSRTQKDPQGRDITIPEHQAPRFKYSKTLRQEITNA